MLEAIFHGHSFVEIRQGDLCLFIDPFIEWNPQCDVSLEEAIAKQPQAIILTHGHDDHLGNTKEIAQATWAQVITSYELGKYCTDVLCIEQVSTHGIGGWVEYEGFYVKLFQAWHGGGISNYTHGYTTVAAGAIIRVWDKTIYHAGDTGLFGDMKLLHTYYTIDVAFLPIGDRYTMGVDDAVIATDWIRPKYVVPVHYNTWPKIKVDAMDFARRVMLDNFAIPKILQPGQAVVLS